jgi:hypothetical protein
MTRTISAMRQKLTAVQVAHESAHLPQLVSEYGYMSLCL